MACTNCFSNPVKPHVIVKYYRKRSSHIEWSGIINHPRVASVFEGRVAPYMVDTAHSTNTIDTICGMQENKIITGRRLDQWLYSETLIAYYPFKALLTFDTTCRLF